MKQIALVLCLVCFYNFGYTQDTIQNSASETKNEDELLVSDETPVFPGCKRRKTEDARKKCMSDKVSRFIMRRYNVDIFNDLNFPSGKYNITIMFKLDKEGGVIEAKARGPHPLLEEEAVRVINKLPRIIPGKAKGKPVTMPYSLSMDFGVY